MKKPVHIDDEKLISLKQLLFRAQTKDDFIRVLCVWLRVKLGMSSTEIGEAVGFNYGTVRRIQSRYFKQGESSLVCTKRGGRHHANLTKEQEELLLEKFRTKISNGDFVPVAEIISAYENIIGRKVSRSTVYRMLDRHKWWKTTYFLIHKRKKV